MRSDLLDDLLHRGLPIIGTAVGAMVAPKGGKATLLGYILAGWVTGWAASRLIQNLTDNFPAIVPTTSFTPPEIGA